jgi:Recombination endonuclease VII
MAIETRQCRVCNKYAPEVFFTNNSVICKDCNKLPGEKYCTRCLVSKPFSDFYWSELRKNYFSYCRECARKRRDALEIEAEKIRLQRHHLKDKYDMTIQEFNTKIQEQDYKCKICKRDRPLGVDHNHTTGQVRDLLCKKCNTAIAFLDESQALLEEAIEYLELWKNKSKDLRHDADPAFTVS